MIRLFRNTETDFSHNEWVLNEIMSCKVTEEINEDYTMELEYPLEDTKNISSNLVTASIISIPTIDSRDNQQFRIIQKETNTNSISIQSQSKLLADLKENRVRSMTIVGKTRKEAIQIILGSALDPHNYKVGNLDTNTNTNVILEVKEGNLLSAIIGSENSVLSEYGGEFIVSNDTIDIVDQRGEDNGVVIEYGKNISSIKETIDLTDLATVLIPKSGDYRLPEYQIVSSNAGAYEKKYYRDVELNLNIWDGTNTKDEKQITVEEAYKIMRDTCDKMFSEDKVDQITFNYVIDFIELSKTEEYKNYKALENVNLGDTVYIKHKKLNLDLQGRVNKISYTVDSEGSTTIDKVEIGFARKNITDIISDTVKQIQFAKQEIVLQISNSEKKLNARLDIQEEKIDAVVEQDGTGMGWELSKNAFKVACVGASGA
ncbi:phage tail spike protein, partial [Clostridium beijerinckii]